MSTIFLQCFQCQDFYKENINISFVISSGSASAQKRSSSCRCSLSCVGAEAELKKHESVEVDVQHQSDEIYSENLTVSSLFAEKGRCSVVVPECLQGDKQFQLRIFSKDNKPFYEKMDLKPGKVIIDLHNFLMNLFTQKLQFCHNLSPLHSNKVTFFFCDRKGKSERV